MSARKRTKHVHEGKYVAEVDIDVLEDDTGWSPYLTAEDIGSLRWFGSTIASSTPSCA